MASENELIALRKCEREDCEYRIPNGVKDLKDIRMAMAGHRAGQLGLGEAGEHQHLDVSGPTLGPRGPRGARSY